MAYNFSDRTYVVTGAGAGIGRAIVAKIVENGGDVIALSLVQAELDSLSKEMNMETEVEMDIPTVRTVQIDLTNWEAVPKALEGLGPIHGLVNNAGTANMAPFINISEQNIDKCFDLNVKALINVSRVVAKNMIDNNTKGAIVNISSVAGKTVFEDATVYCATKHAVESITQNMALELGKQGIRVNSVNPTFVKTELSRGIWEDTAHTEKIKAKTPMGRWAETSEVADAVVYLLSDNASMVNGIALPVDGGYLTIN